MQPLKIEQQGDQLQFNVNFKAQLQFDVKGKGLIPV